MITRPLYERDLPDVLDDLAAGPYPDYLDGVLSVTARRRQRPRWTSPERWLPMDLALRRASARPVPWRALAVLAILLLLVALAVATVGQRQRLPAPFGPAVNGVIPYAADGDIFLGDPVATTSRTVITGPTHDWEPVFSRDGTRLAFWRGDGVDDSRGRLMVAQADGSRIREISATIVGVRWWDWTPDGRIVVVAGSFDPGFRIIDPDRPYEAVSLAEGFGIDVPVFRPGTDQILFRGRSAEGIGLYVMNADGSGLHPILGPRPTTLDQVDLVQPRYSPDGTRIAVQHWDDATGHVAIQILDPSGHVLKEILPEAPDWFIGWPVWSNDGTRIIAQHSRDTSDGSSPVQPHVIVDVTEGGGGRHETGPSLPANGATVEWAPDDTFLLMLPNEATGRQQFLDPAGGAPRPAPWETDSYPNIQRLAP